MKENEDVRTLIETHYHSCSYIEDVLIRKNLGSFIMKMCAYHAFT